MQALQHRLEGGGCFFGLLLFFFVLQATQVDGALGDVLQRLALEVVEVREQPFVDAVGQQQHLDALLLEEFELRAALGGHLAVGGDDVDGLLAFLHARHVIGQRHALRARLVVRGGKAEQLGQTLLVGKVFADAFLEHGAELSPEGRVLVALGLVFVIGQLFKHGQHALGAAFTDGLDVAAFLQDLAADVEWQVGRVDHALDEAQVVGQQRFGVVHDEDALDVELEAAALVAVPQVERGLGGHVQQLGVFAAAFDAVVGVGQRVLAVVADLFVERLILLGGDVALATRPQGGRLVDGFPLVLNDVLTLVLVPLFLLHQDGQGDVVGVLANDATQLPGGEEFVLTFAQVQGDVGAAGGFGDGVDFEIASAFAAPAHALFGLQASAARFDGDAVGDDVAAVKAHAELANELGVFLLVAGETAHEVLGAALGDGAEVVDRLLRAHADAVVADGDGAVGLVDQHAHVEVGRVFIQGAVIEGLEAQLVARVGRVGDQLAQEDFLVGVQRVRDQVQQLLDFGLEGMGLLGHGLF